MMSDFERWLENQDYLAIDHENNSVIVGVKDANGVIYWRNAFEEFQKVIKKTEPYQMGWNDALREIAEEYINSHDIGSAETLELFRAIARIGGAND